MNIFVKTSLKVILGSLFFICLLENCEAKPADLDSKKETIMIKEIMKSHVMYKKMTPLIARRSLESYVDELDPSKTFFLYSDIQRWYEPTKQLVEKVESDFAQSSYEEFFKIFTVFQKAIERRKAVEEELSRQYLPKEVKMLTTKEQKELAWCATENELLERLKRFKAIQMVAAAKIGGTAEEVAAQRWNKRIQKIEEEYCGHDTTYNEKLVLTGVLKAVSSSLDSHTTYFTPNEADQFLIAVQSRLLGIGVQLRDDIDGFTVVKIVEGGPADTTKELKVNDKIIAINKEPVIGLDVSEVVERIRGQEGTQVVLRVVRQAATDGTKAEILKDIVIPRGDVVLKESRFEIDTVPFGNGAIAVIHLHSFYEDADSSSSEDIFKAMEEVKKKNNITGVVLDLRSNAGGVLSQAVAVTGLFIKKGVVVSIKDETGIVHPLRDLDSKMMWDGPLIVLINRASASAAEIVTQTLQDYGRALIVGDDHTFGKGTFQTFTLPTGTGAKCNPQGEYKVTRGCYYTVSGKTPQLTGVKADIIVPSGMEYFDVGEIYSKFPLEADTIPPRFEDPLDDVPLFQRERIRNIYKLEQQKKEALYTAFLPQLKANSEIRQKQNKAYKNLLTSLKEQKDIENMDHTEKQADFQLEEGLNIMRDLILFSR